MINGTILILIIVLGVMLSGFFSGAETGMYQISRLRLRLGVEKKKLSFLILNKALHDSSGLLISMLAGTNLAHYITTSVVTYMLLSRLQAEHTAELLATFLIAPFLFVFSEVIPKTIFLHRSDALMPAVAPLILAFHKLFSWSGIVPLLKKVSFVFAQLTGSVSSPKTAITAAQRHQVSALLKDTHEEGLLSRVQADIINRLVNISQVGIKAVMTPLGKIQAIDINSDRTALLKKLQESVFTRMPVYDRWPENIKGFINIYDCLNSAKQFADLGDFVEPMQKIRSETAVFDAINIMQRENQKIVLVTSSSRIGREVPVGVVTMKDLVEELVGELAEW